jgi:hypothetical protein
LFPEASEKAGHTFLVYRDGGQIIQEEAADDAPALLGRQGQARLPAVPEMSGRRARLHARRPGG